MAYNPYTGMIKSLMYTIVCIYPDQTFIVGLLSNTKIQLSQHYNNNNIKRIFKFPIIIVVYTLYLMELNCGPEVTQTWIGLATSTSVCRFCGISSYWIEDPSPNIAKKWNSHSTSIKNSYVVSIALVLEAIWLRSLFKYLVVVLHAPDLVTLQSDSISEIDYRLLQELQIS